MEQNFNASQFKLGNLVGKIDLSKIDSPTIKNNIKNNNFYITINIDGKEIVETKASDKAPIISDNGTKQGYHAVFLSNGQVYFGKLGIIGGKKFVKLRDIFYLADNISADTGTNNDRLNLGLSLAKLGEEVHAPVDEMNINVDHITFWEKLQDNGLLVQAIVKFYEQRLVDDD